MRDPGGWVELGNIGRLLDRIAIQNLRCSCNMWICDMFIGMH